MTRETMADHIPWDDVNEANNNPLPYTAPDGGRHKSEVEYLKGVIIDIKATSEFRLDALVEITAMLMKIDEVLTDKDAKLFSVWELHDIIAPFLPEESPTVEDIDDITEDLINSEINRTT